MDIRRCIVQCTKSSSVFKMRSVIKTACFRVLSYVIQALKQVKQQE